MAIVRLTLLRQVREEHSGNDVIARDTIGPTAYTCIPLSCIQTSIGIVVCRRKVQLNNLQISLCTNWCHPPSQETLHCPILHVQQLFTVTSKHGPQAKFRDARIGSAFQSRFVPHFWWAIVSLFGSYCPTVFVQQLMAPLQDMHFTRSAKVTCNISTSQGVFCSVLQLFMGQWPMSPVGSSDGRIFAQLNAQK